MFLLIPVGVQYTARRYPMVTFTLMGVNILLYLISLVQFWVNLDGSMEQREWMALNLGLVPAQAVWYTFLTCTFVHAGFFHLLGNMIYLFLFGSCVEDFLGRWQYVVFYLLGGLAASLVQFGVTSPGADALVPVVGASGAITACIGGFVPLLLKSKINFQYIALLFFRFYSGNFWLPAWLVISFWFLSDVFWAVRSYQNPQGGGGVAFAAHVGGFLAGLAMIAGWKFFIGPHQQPVEENSADPVAAGGTAALGAGHGGAEKASIFLFQNEQQVGPYTRSQIHEMLQAGSIAEDAVYWYEGMADWQGIGRFSGR